MLVFSDMLPAYSVPRIVRPRRVGCAYRYRVSAAVLVHHPLRIAQPLYPGKVFHRAASGGVAQKVIRSPVEIAPEITQPINRRLQSIADHILPELVKGRIEVLHAVSLCHLLTPDVTAVTFEQHRRLIELGEGWEWGGSGFFFFYIIIIYIIIISLFC